MHVAGDRVRRGVEPGLSGQVYYSLLPTLLPVMPWATVVIAFRVRLNTHTRARVCDAVCIHSHGYKVLQSAICFYYCYLRGENWIYNQIVIAAVSRTVYAQHSYVHSYLTPLFWSFLICTVHIFTVHFTENCVRQKEEETVTTPEKQMV